MKKRMITTATLIAYFAMMSALGVVASVPANVSSAAKENLRKEISSQIICPSFVTSNSETNNVRAIVQVNEQGRVGVLEISSANEELKDYVIKELSKIKISHPGTTEQFVLIIKFRVV